MPGWRTDYRAPVTNCASLVTDFEEYVEKSTFSTIACLQIATWVREYCSPFIRHGHVEQKMFTRTWICNNFLLVNSEVFFAALRSLKLHLHSEKKIRYP